MISQNVTSSTTFKDKQGNEIARLGMAEAKKLSKSPKALNRFLDRLKGG